MVNERKGAPLLSGIQTVQSMRDTGYKSTDYAIAELIDNSIQAAAENVLVVLVEDQVQGRVRTTTQVREVWVFDDGRGMDDELANVALSFGGSDRYDDRSGIGRFGMGLPQASVSQCRRTDLWTWKNPGEDDPGIEEFERREPISFGGPGPSNAHHTYLDLSEIEATAGSSLRVPWPTGAADPNHAAVPEWARRTAERELKGTLVGGQEMPAASGTIVAWTEIDRSRWARSTTVKEHTEYLLGRVYRRFLGKGEKARDVSIKFAVLDRADAERGVQPERMEEVIPNDPTYLSSPESQNLGFWEMDNPDYEEGSSEPKLVAVREEAPFKVFASETSFRLLGRPESTGEQPEGEVTVRCSMAKPGVRPNNIGNPGRNTHQGRHMYRNRGISVVRADREITLEDTYVYEATDRWWSVEVAFDPVLDEVFGVTNNKQDVPHFSVALRHAINADEEDEGVPDAIVEGEWTEDHALAELYKVAAKCVGLIRQMRKDQKAEHDRFRENAQASGKKGRAQMPAVAMRVKSERGENRATPGEEEFQALVEREGEEGARAKTAEELSSSLREQGLTEEEARAAVENYREGMILQVIEYTQGQAPAFFWPAEFGDLETININRAHPANPDLLDALRVSDERVRSLPEEDAKRLLGRAVDALGWLLMAWCRMELEHQQVQADASAIRRWRERWGQVLGEIVSGDVYSGALADEPELSELLGEEDED